MADKAFRLMKDSFYLKNKEEHFSVFETIKKYAPSVFSAETFEEVPWVRICTKPDNNKYWEKLIRYMFLFMDELFFRIRKNIDRIPSDHELFDSLEDCMSKIPKKGCFSTFGFKISNPQKEMKSQYGEKFLRMRYNKVFFEKVYAPYMGLVWVMLKKDLKIHASYITEDTYARLVVKLFASQEVIGRFFWDDKSEAHTVTLSEVHFLRCYYDIVRNLVHKFGVPASIRPLFHDIWE